MFLDSQAQDRAHQICRESLIRQVCYTSCPSKERIQKLFVGREVCTFDVKAVSRDVADELRRVEDNVTQDFSVARQKRSITGDIGKVVHSVGTALQW